MGRSFDSPTNARHAGLDNRGVLAPVLSLSGTSLGFGSVLPDSSSATQTVTIANGGGAAIALAGTGFSGRR